MATPNSILRMVLLWYSRLQTLPDRTAASRGERRFALVEAGDVFLPSPVAAGVHEPRDATRPQKAVQETSEEDSKVHNRVP